MEDFGHWWDPRKEKRERETGSWSVVLSKTSDRSQISDVQTINMHNLKPKFVDTYIGSTNSTFNSSVNISI